MIAGVHYKDERLVELLSSEADLHSDEHLSTCDDCRTRLESFRMVAGILHDPAVWDERPLNEDPVPATIAALRAFADQMTAEDAVADLAVNAMLTAPGETWSLSGLPQTAGTVRKLIEASERAIDTMPPDAVTLAALATSLAESLDATSYTSDTVPRLRGAAWRQRAYALFYTGSFSDAEEAICASERHFAESLVDEYELARVGIVKASVDRGLEKYEPAIRAARNGAAVFNRYEDTTRSVSARLAEVNLLFSTGQLEAAYDALIAIKRKLEDAYDPDTYARVLGNLGSCCWGLGRSAEALLHQEAAASLFDELGNHSAATRARWNIARVLAYAGQHDEAVRRFLELRGEFVRLGMMAAATQAGLDAAEILVAQRQFDVVEEICRTAMRTIEDARVVYTAPALTALSLMKEAAQNRTATATFVRRVREYIDRIPDEPTLLFAFAPE